MKQAFLMAAGALALSLAATAPASAVDFSTAGDSVVLDFNGIVDGVVDPDLDADLTLTLLSITGGTDWEFSYSLENNSGGDDLLSRVTAFGFNVDPDFDTASISGDFTTWSSGTTSGGLPAVEFCGTSGATCSGGAGGGVTVGDTFTGTLHLIFGDSTDLISLTDFYVRYQSLGADGEGSGVGVPGDGGGGGGGGGIPEPATWAMMILGFGGVGALMRRRRRLEALV